MSGGWLRAAARGLALLWAGWWIFLGIAAFLKEPFTREGLTVLIGFCLVFLVSALVGWRWEALGGAVLIAEGLVILAGYPLVARTSFGMAFLLILTTALPAIGAGALFLAGRRGRLP